MLRKNLLGTTSLLLILVLGQAHWAQADEGRPLWGPGETALLSSMIVGAGLAGLADRDIRDAARKNRHPDLDSLAKGLGTATEPVTDLGIGGAIFLYGLASRNETVQQTGTLAFEAVLAAELATLGLKVAAGRLRPGPENESDSFRPFSFGGERNALPSGHAAGAFALASVLSRRSQSTAAPYLYYGLAGLAGLSRIYEEEHWASDVVVGALVGELAGRLVIHWHEREQERLKVSVLPYRDGALVALGLKW